ncbi:MAG: histidine phosphatase family protein [Acetobacteraceae bacterium]|nr:histidine phosphatase family protein [Acetobacteraceae bacterium]
MGVILTLISHAATVATRQAAFPLDEPLEQRAQGQAAALAGQLRRVDRAITSPALRARQTAAALGLQASVVSELRDLDCGRWAGRTLADVTSSNPDDVLAWTRDCTAKPHGGESVTELIERTARWLEAIGPGAARTVAVTHPATLRAALIVALRAEAAAFWRIDVAPLCRLRLRSNAGGWTLLSFEP